jgi:bifunctional non-homologous end joining protein LigD
MQRVSAKLFVEPMMGSRFRDLPAGKWIYEIKFDGYRALALKAGSEVQLVSRNRKSFTKNYPGLIASLKRLPASSATIDGEIVALDASGKPSFQLLQSYAKSRETPLVYYAFDLLTFDGKDQRIRPLVERREVLAKLLEGMPANIQYSEGLRGNKEDLVSSASTSCRKCNRCRRWFWTNAFPAVRRSRRNKNCNRRYKDPAPEPFEQCLIRNPGGEPER